MKKVKKYTVNAKIVYVNKKDKVTNCLCKIEKEIARKIYDNFSDLGKIRFGKDEKDDNSLTFWAVSFDERKIEWGNYKLTLIVAQGNERYPDPTFRIEEFEFLGRDLVEEEILGEVDFTKKTAKIEPSQQNTEKPRNIAEYYEQLEPENDLPF